MGKYWFKVGNDLIKDEKVGPLPDNVWRRMIECFNMASLLDPDNTGDGELPPLETMCWFTRQTPETLTNELQELVKLGIVSQNPDKSYRVTNFAKRQGPVDSAERKRAQRAATGVGGYGDVTNPSRFRDGKRDPEVQSTTTTTLNKGSSSSKNTVTNTSRQRDNNVTALLTQLDIQDRAQPSRQHAPAVVQQHTVTDILANHDPDGAIAANLRRWAAAAEAGAEITDRPALVWCKIVEGQAPPADKENGSKPWYAGNEDLIIK